MKQVLLRRLAINSFIQKYRFMSINEVIKTCCFPAYMRDVKKPETPNDLEGLSTITTGIDSSNAKWVFRGDEIKPISPKSRLHFNDLGLVLRAVLAHKGIAVLPEVMLKKLLENGSILELLPQWRCPSKSVYLIYQSRRLLTLAQQAFIDMMMLNRNNKK